MIEVQLVNSTDEPTGTMEKLEAHEKGLLHRAISVLIFNSNQEILLQRRLAQISFTWFMDKYCCSHPYPNENARDAAMRRQRR